MTIKKLAKELEKKGIKKNAMPNKIGISYTSIINYLTGKRVMPLDIFLKIIETYKINIRCIFDEKYFKEEISKKEIENVETAEITKLKLKIFELEIRLDECRRKNDVSEFKKGNKSATS